MLRDDLKMLSFLELKEVLKELRYEQRIALITYQALEDLFGENYTYDSAYVNARNSYFGICTDIDRVTFRMRNIMRQRRKQFKNIKSSKEY